jgi:hypothetical protein
MKMVLPVQRYSPCAGITVDRTDQSVRITGSMQMYGPMANAARATSVQNTINTTWTTTFPDGHSVSCNITVTYRGPESSAANVTQIYVANISGPSHVSHIGATSMTLNASGTAAFTWVAAHEFGHIIGLQDRYSESIISRIRGRFGGVRSNTIQPGYTGNIMGQHGGTLSSQNLRDLASENEPSSWWFNDDNHVRDWVNAHSRAEIRALSTDSKLRMIRTLMGGWISDADVNAIVAIAASVNSRTEANVIRGGINLTDFQGLGQRMRVRIAFDNMPS